MKRDCEPGLNTEQAPAGPRLLGEHPREGHGPCKGPGAGLGKVGREGSLGGGMQFRGTGGDRGMDCVGLRGQGETLRFT